MHSIITGRTRLLRPPHWPFALRDAPVTRQLKHAWLGFGADPSRLRDLVAGADTNTDTLGVRGTTLGAVKYLNGGLNATYSLTGGIATIAIWFRSSHPVGLDRLVSHNNDELDIGTNYSGSSLAGVPSGNLGMHVRSTGLGWVNLGAAPVGEVNLVVVRVRAGSIKASMNGRDTYSATPGPGLVTLTSVSFGKRFSTGNVNQHDHVSTLVWNRFLSDSEVFSLYQPQTRWAWLEEFGRRAYSLPTTLSISPKVAVAGLAHLQTLGQPAVSALYVIGPGGLTQVQSIAQPVISPASVLAAQGIVQGHSLAQPLLSATYLVDPADLVQGQNLDATGLALAFALSPDMLMHIHSLNQPVLAPAVAVAPGNLAQAHGISEPILDLLVRLSPASIAMSQTLGIPLVIGVGSRPIVPAALRHPQTLGIPLVIDVGLRLIVPEALRHPQTIHIPVLAPAVTLDVRSLIQVHLLTNAVIYVPHVPLAGTHQLLVLEDAHRLVVSENVHQLTAAMNMHQLVVLDASDQVLVMSPDGGVVLTSVRDLLLAEISGKFN